MKTISVIIRTLNEQKYLEELLCALRSQDVPGFDLDLVVVDSGSTDKTLEIAQAHGARITKIKKEEFSFGRSLNIGCEFALGEILVFISGHCVPCNDKWLIELVKPLSNGCVYTYGRQVGRDTTKFSETLLFEKYFPDQSMAPQLGFFCNNANAAINRCDWELYQFDESLPGCEDMDLAKKLVNSGKNIGYCAAAAVYHIHDETWPQVMHRFEREAIALQKIMPEVQLSMVDVIRFIIVSIVTDFRRAFSDSVLFAEALNIIKFRFFQYVGAYRGNKRVVF